MYEKRKKKYLQLRHILKALKAGGGGSSGGSGGSGGGSGGIGNYKPIHAHSLTRYY